jgi:hypothetical protein
MKTLDESAPKNSVILVADWTLVSEYYYYRIAENFRPDLVVLNYDLKFTNYNIIKIMYPDFYKLIQPEYDKFVIELANAHPQQIYNTGCDLSTNESRNAFVSALYKISAVCKQHNYPLMFDPQAFVTFSQSKLFSANVFVSGCFLSEVRTDMGHDFIKLPFKWLDMPLIKHEPGAADKIVDMEAMLDFHQRYAVANNDTVSLPVIVAAHNKIKALEAEMKENAPFLYK